MYRARSRKSEPPVGASSSFPLGNRAAVRRALSREARAASGAAITSAGTSGIAPGSGGGAEDAVGQRRQSLMRSLRTSVAGSKGAASEGSIAVSVR